VIRSSATCEDSPLLSFAGQYSSFLNVRGGENIIKAIKLCYQSLFSDNAKIYSKINGIRLEYESMAIAVQELAPVTVAGVIFTADPVNQDDKKMIVEYTKGLGDSIVSGHKKPILKEIEKTKINNLEKLKNDLFLRACKKEETNRTPIWIMRQAGRYLPEYQKVRANSDFKTMVKTPELATEVTIQPVDIIGVDAAIIFSDILVIPEALGMNYEMVESRGPSFDWTITEENDFNRLSNSDLEDKLSYVFKALKMTKKELNGRVPLIGFSGSPWTLLTYMVEGGGSKNFSKINKSFVLSLIVTSLQVFSFNISSI